MLGSKEGREYGMLEMMQKTHKKTEETALTLRVSPQVAHLYFHATPQQRQRAVDWFSELLKTPSEKKREKAKADFLHSLRELQQEAVANGMTLKKAKELMGEDAENLF